MGTAAEQARLAFLGSVFDLRGRSALVTGAGSGLGAAMAEALARAGAGVLLADVNPATAGAASARLRAEGLAVAHASVDVAEPEQIAAGLDEAERVHGPVDIVFANAGVSSGRGPRYEGGRIEDVRPEVWERTLRVNLGGVFHTLQAAARRMRGRGGRIVVTSSIAGAQAETMVGYPYVAAKAAVTNMVRQAALDLAPDNVLVNAILPGPFKTSIGAPAGSPQREALNADFASTVPLGRVAETSEMRGLALFLASPASSFVTGAAFVIDGGSLAGR